MKMLKCGFTNVRKAEDVVNDLKFAFDWKSAELTFDEQGSPCVQYRTKDDEDRGDYLFNLDDICAENSDGTCLGDSSFNERFDYVFSVWGKDDDGNWCLGYEG